MLVGEHLLVLGLELHLHSHHLVISMVAFGLHRVSDLTTRLLEILL